MQGNSSSHFVLHFSKSKLTHCIDIKGLLLSVKLMASSLQKRPKLLHFDIRAREGKKFLMPPQTKDGDS